MKRLSAIMLIVAMAVLISGCTDRQIRTALVDMGYAPADPDATPQISPSPDPTPDNVKVVGDVRITLGPSKVQLDKKKLTLQAGKSKKLKATVKPKKADKTVEWYSSDESVATVNKKGKITARSSGQATITCETVNGLTATCEVTVVKNKSKS